MCSMNVELHQCTEMIEMSCCDMMGTNNENKSPDCCLELSENSCDYIYVSISLFTFIIPKTIDSKVELVQHHNANIDINIKIISLTGIKWAALSKVYRWQKVNLF